MKKIIIIAGLFLVSSLSIYAQEYCDTLKLKTIKANYGFIGEGGFNRIGNLDSAVINIDTLPIFHPEMVLVNISNDTFLNGTSYNVEIYYGVYTDIGMIAWRNPVHLFQLNRNLLPNDTVRLGFSLDIDLLEVINDVKEVQGVDFEEISYWEMIIGIGYTSHDGVYSESIFWAGTDTSIFYVVKTPVSIQEKKKEASVISVFPNPARSQFTITNTENTEIQLYNMVGQEVLRTYSKEENTVVNVDFLPQGMYVLKVLKGGVFSTHKIVINNKQY